MDHEVDIIFLEKYNKYLYEIVKIFQRDSQLESINNIHLFPGINIQLSFINYCFSQVRVQICGS